MSFYFMLVLHCHEAVQEHAFAASVQLQQAFHPKASRDFVYNGIAWSQRLGPIADSISDGITGAFHTVYQISVDIGLI